MAITNGTNITALEKPAVGVDTGPGWATALNNSIDAVDGHDHTTNKGSRITPAAININADLEMNSNDLTEIRTLSMDSTSGTTTADQRAIYVSGSNNLHYRNGSGQDVQITDGTSVMGAAGTITGMGSDEGNQAGANYTEGSKAFNFFTDIGNTDFGKMNHSDLNLYKFSDDNTVDTDFVTLQCSSSVSGAGGTITVPGETGTLLTTATNFAGTINIDATGGSGSITLDANTSVSIEADTTITLDAESDINLDSNSGVLTFKDNGTAIGKISNSSSDLVIENEVDAKDIIFKQYDGNEVARFTDDRKLKFFDDGDEYISGDGTDLTVASGGALNLTATTDVVVPANVGVTFGTGEKIEGNNTDLTITSGADINLTATSDINVPADVGITFGDDGEKIEGNGTDLTIASSGEINFNSGTLDLSAQTVDVTLNGAVDALNFDSNTLSIDASNNRIGIGSAAPKQPLTVYGVPITATGTIKTQTLIADTTAFGSAQNSGISFGHKYDSGGDVATTSGIVGGRESTSDGNYAGYLSFHTRANGASGAEQARITSAGRVGIGTTVPYGALNVSDSGGFTTLVITDPTENASGEHWYFRNTGGNFYIGQSTDSGGAFDSLQARVTVADGGNVTLNSGNLVVGTAGKGIDFSAQTSSTGTDASIIAELLDHYEWGTYRVVLTPDSGTFTMDTSRDLLGFVKVGNICTVSGYARVSSTSGPSGLITFNLPFAASSMNEYANHFVGHAVPENMGGSPPSYYSSSDFHCFIGGAGATTAQIKRTAGGTAAENWGGVADYFSTNTNVTISITYITA
jgi:hypothetical protein